jgi:hypothetical protein
MAVGRAEALVILQSVVLWRSSTAMQPSRRKGASVELGVFRKLKVNEKGALWAVCASKQIVFYEPFIKVTANSTSGLRILGSASITYSAV